MASKELSAELKMRQLQFGKGDGKGKDLKGSRKGERGDQERKGATQKEGLGNHPSPPRVSPPVGEVKKESVEPPWARITRMVSRPRASLGQEWAWMVFSMWMWATWVRVMMRDSPVAVLGRLAEQD